MTPDELDTFLVTAKKHGVKRLEASGQGVIAVEFFEPVSTEPTNRTAPADIAKALAENVERCRCGHEVTEHGQGGYCLHGCAVEKCQADDPGKSP